jgi:hypothetical protein
MSITVPRFRFPLGYDPCDPTTAPREQQKLLFIRPWNRFKTTCINTDNNLTQEQIQMRVKAEVLQYKQQHIRHTKTEKYALAAREHYKKRHYVPKAHVDENGNLVPAKNTIINNGVVFFDDNCDKIIVHKSTASDVPGKSVDLFLDPDVPLLTRKNPPRVYRAGGTSNVDNTVYNPVNNFNLF